MPSEAETARSVGTAAENTNDVSLTHWLSATIRGPAQARNPPDDFGSKRNEPMSILRGW